uniref:Uncharacterized protein n=1 Tax=Romanomermis culicivorax TaxID=13658 RepID=A0A915I882_ROMCU
MLGKGPDLDPNRDWEVKEIGGHAVIYYNIIIVILWTETSAEENSCSDHRLLSVENEGNRPTTSSAAKREDDNTILSSNEDQIFKIPSLTNLRRRGDLLQPPINGPGRPIPKMSIPVVDQQQPQPTNKHAQVLSWHDATLSIRDEVLAFF